MGSKSSKPAGSTTSVQTSEPWAEQKPYLTDVFSKAQDLYANKPLYYSGDTYAAPSQSQYDALLGLDGTARNDNSAYQAGGLSSKFMDGHYLGNDAGSKANEQFSGENGGIGAPGSGTLNTLSAANQSLNNPGWGSLRDQAGTNLGITGPGTSSLSDLAQKNGIGLQGSGYLNDIAGTNQALNNPSWGALRDQVNTNVGTTNQGASYLGDFARMSGPADNRLASFADFDTAAGNDANTMLRHQAGAGVSNPAAGYMRDIAAGGPNQYGSISDLNRFSASGAANPGAGALNSYANGSRLAYGNPYMDAVSKSVLSRVVPGIQSQFINSGTLSSPEAARATAAGAASALAPYEFGQYQNEEQSQIDAAKGLNSQSIQSRGLQQQAAHDAATNSIAVNTLRGNVGETLGNQALSERGLQGTAANNLANSLTSGWGLQYGAANNYGSQAMDARRLAQGAATDLSTAALEGGKLQQNAASTLGDQYLTGAGLQNTAATALGTQELSGRTQQQSAASALNDAALKGGQLQYDAAKTLGDQYLTGAGLQGQSATTLGTQSLTGRGLQQDAAKNYTSGYNGQLDEMMRTLGLAPQTQLMQYTPGQMLYSSGQTSQNLNQAAIDDSVAEWNWNQNLPYDQLNQYSNAVQGNYGSTTSRTDPYFQNRTGNALSGALGGASLGSSLAGGLGVSSGTGSLLGGGLGTMLSIFSDRRLKANIAPVGALDNGLTVYAYRYLDDPADMRRIGLMADEVEALHPEAVQTVPSGPLAGAKMVNYARAVE